MTTRAPSRIAGAFCALVDAAPSAAAVIDGMSGRVSTRRDLLRRSEEIAAELELHDVGAGELVAVQLENSLDFLAVFLACLARRATLVPLDRDARDTEVATILHHFGIRALVFRNATGSAEQLPAITIREIEPRRLPAEPYIALLKLTSGSTGRPKGILASEDNLVADARNICSSMGIEPGDLNLGAIPFSHSYGFSNLVTPLLLQGTAIVATNQYLPLSLVELANRYGCSVFPGIPMIFDHLSQLPKSDGELTPVRTFISAGAPLAPSVSMRFRERFGRDIHSFYGCSECGGIAYDREGGSVERGSVGKAMDGVTLTLAEGRLVIESEAVTQGYLLGGEEESPVFWRGVFLSDDLARWSEQGELELTGRIGDLINTAGKKVNPREIEQILLQMNGIREAKVWGEAAGARGQVVAAAIVAGPEITREQIRDFCRLHLSSHKIPRILKLLEQMPLDERGKFKRSALQAIEG